MKQIKIKTKKLGFIAYNQGWVTDTNWAIKADFLELDDSLMADKVRKDEKFVKTSYGELTDNAPNIEQNIPKSKGEDVKMTDILIRSDKVLKRVFVCCDELFTLDEDYVQDFILKFKTGLEGIELRKQDSRENSPLLVVRYNEIIALIMPIITKSNDYNKLKLIADKL